MTDHHDALDRYLDDLANHRIPRDELDPGLVATIDQITEIGVSPVPDWTFVDHLEDTLMNAVSTAPALRALTPLRTITLSPEMPGRLTSPLARPSRWVPILISAALLLLTIGVAFGPLRPSNDGTGRGPAIPAAVVQASPSPEEAAGTVLLEFPLPAQALPPDGFGNLGLRYFTMAPNTTAAWEASPSTASPGIWANYVVSGSLTMAAEGEVAIFRGAGDETPEIVPAGTEIILAAGDSALHDTLESATWTSTGAESVEMVSIFLTHKYLLPFPTPTGWEQLRINNFYPAPVPAGDWVVRLEVIELEPDAEIPAPVAGVVQSAVTAPESDAHLARSADGGFALRGGTTTATAYLFTVEQTREGDTREP